MLRHECGYFLRVAARSRWCSDWLLQAEIREESNRLRAARSGTRTVDSGQSRTEILWSESREVRRRFAARADGWHSLTSCPTAGFPGGEDVRGAILTLAARTRSGEGQFPRKIEL